MTLLRTSSCYFSLFLSCNFRLFPCFSKCLLPAFFLCQNWLKWCYQAVAGHRPALISHQLDIPRYLMSRRTYWTFSCILIRCDFPFCPSRVLLCLFHSDQGLYILLLEYGVGTKSMGDREASILKGPCWEMDSSLFVAWDEMRTNSSCQLYSQQLAKVLQFRL